MKDVANVKLIEANCQYEYKMGSMLHIQYGDPNIVKLLEVVHAKW